MMAKPAQKSWRLVVTGTLLGITKQKLTIRSTGRSPATRARAGYLGRYAALRHLNMGSFCGTDTS